MTITRRNFLRASATTMSAAAVASTALGGLTASGQNSDRQNGQTGMDVILDGVGKPVPVKIHIAAGEPVRVMRGGIGASFHAVSADLPGIIPSGGGSWSGSESGGNPEPSDDRRWEELFRHAEWLGMDWCRVELEQRMYEPGRRDFDWDNPEMKTLYRILDWAEHRKVDVFLTQMWGDVAWNAYPGNADDPIKRLRSAPYSIPEWAYGLGELVNHLTRVKAYTCIRWVCVEN